jgi:hypothetical protein
MSIIPTFRRLRQENLESKASLDYIARLKKKKEKENKERGGRGRRRGGGAGGGGRGKGSHFFCNSSHSLQTTESF